MHTFDLSMEHLTKVEGAAALDIKVKDDKVTSARFKITESKRFFTEAMKGQSITALPSLLSRICGTCSNAHLLCSIEACERALDITPTDQTMTLRNLTMHGLVIRDHALHLYLFSMPDLFNKDSFLDFDEDNPTQHQMLHDGFEVKGAGNFLATLIAGRSVHAVYPTIGGFIHFPDKQGVAEAIKKLQAARPAVVRLIEIFKNAPFHFDRQTEFMALIPEKSFGYLTGCIKTKANECIGADEYRDHLEKIVLPYSQATAYKHKQKSYMVGALARINLAKDLLHPKTKATAAAALKLFPSTDIYYNNLAQAIEILHSIDESIDLLQNNDIKPEPVIKPVFKEGIGIGVIEAPRGTLYHRVHVGADGKVIEGEIVVPTGQNQINIEEDMYRLVEELIPKMPPDQMGPELEKLIRAYDPCMSCASHFLKVNWCSLK